MAGDVVTHGSSSMSSDIEICPSNPETRLLIDSAIPQMLPLADTVGFILVHPEGTLLNGDQHWNVDNFTTGT